jgi:hypothetical protein
MTPLRELIAGDAFKPTRTFDALARFHVPFERLTSGAEIESVLRRALERGDHAVVTGRPGAGKSSVLASLLHPPAEMGRHYAPIRLGIGGDADRRRLGDPRQLANRILGDLAANYLEPDDAAAVRERGAPVVRVTGPTDTFRAQIGGRLASVSREIRQAADSYDIERTAAEVLAVVATAVRALASEAVEPVLLLEDADGLLRLPGLSDEERHGVAEEFFAHGLGPVLTEIRVPMLMAAQPAYRDLDAYRELLVNLAVAEVELPRPNQFTPDGVRDLVDHAIGAAGSSRTIDAVFEPEALRTLIALRYSMPTVRSLMAICGAAAVEADAEGRDRIGEADVGYAASQTLQD